MYILLSAMQLKKVFHKKGDIRDPNKNKSYCAISNYILNITATNLVLCIICGIMGCIDQLFIVYHLLDYVESISLIINITQIYEWITMVLIMIWQKGKDLTQIIIIMDDNKCHQFKK